MRVIIKFIFKIFAIILYRPKIVGKENLPKDGGALLCPNHVSTLEAALKAFTDVVAEELKKGEKMAFYAGSPIYLEYIQ